MFNNPIFSRTKKISLIIPTVHHRAALFRRTLQFLSNSRFAAPIIVSDHSPDAARGTIAEVVDSVSGLDITLLQHAPELHFLRRLVSCASKVKTPYVHLHADDDFLALSAVAPLVRVLEDKPECVAAMGINLHIDFDNKNLRLMPKGEVAHADAGARLIAQLEAYSSVLYALRRTEEFVSSLTFSVEHCPDVQFWQYLESCVAALCGSIQVIDELHYIRSVHHAKWSSTLVREKSPDHFPYLILSPDFQPRLSAFRGALLEACRTREVIVDEQVLDQSLIHLLARGLSIMGLPATRYGAKAISDRQQAHSNWVNEKFANANDPAAQMLQQIFDLPA